MKNPKNEKDIKTKKPSKRKLAIIIWASIPFVLLFVFLISVGAGFGGILKSFLKGFLPILLLYIFFDLASKINIPNPFTKKKNKS